MFYLIIKDITVDRKGAGYFSGVCYTVASLCCIIHICRGGLIISGDLLNVYGRNFSLMS